MKKLVIAIVLLGGIYILWRKVNHRVEKPFKAVIFSVLQKVDGSGYALVLRSVDRTKPHEWLSAVVTESVRAWDTVIVDRANDRILYKGNREGVILKKK